MTSMTQKIKRKFLEIFVLLVIFEILSHYPYIDISHWLKKDVHWITDKNFMEKFMVMASTRSSRTFLLNFWFLPIWLFLLKVIRLIVISY